jgi:predicted transcriptional regulator
MEGLMAQAQEGSPSGSQVGSNLDDLVAKVKAVAQSSHAELFARIVDGFYEQITEEYFAPEDLAEIEEGFARIRRGEYVTLEEMEKELGL